MIKDEEVYERKGEPMEMEKESGMSRIRRAVLLHTAWTFACVTLLAFGWSVGSAHAAGNLSWKSDDGDHKVDVGLVTRFRAEYWDVRASDDDSFAAWRSRINLKYTWKDRMKAFIEFQDARINGMGSDSSGGAALYRASAGPGSKTSSQRLRQLWLDFDVTESLSFRAGRQDIKLGTEVMYPEGNWKYLKIKRVSQRLVGTVGWTHGERSNDGVSASYDFGDYHLYAWGAKPTTGVFDIDGAYSTQDDILYGGASFTAKRGTWLRDTEVRLFGIAYRDDRNTSDGGLDDSRALNIYTGGFSLIGIYPYGDGNVDLTLWGAYQWGDWPIAGDHLSHSAWAGLAETGYQFTNVQMKPWIRVGINAASGDGSSTDGDHESFFNILPTNHLYYGFQDQFALGNLLNYFAQLKLKPTEKSDFDITLHQFSKWTTDDGRHFGTGAFDRSSFGFGLDVSDTSRNMGTAVDLTLGYKLHKNVHLQGGYSYMWGHGQWNGLSDDDARWAYFQVTAKY